mgnify:CR=1 FL=1
MGKAIAILGILIIAGLFWYVAYDSMNLQQATEKQFSEAKRLIHEFGDSGEEIQFFLDPQPPLTEFTYVENQVQKTVFNNNTGQYENVTATEIEKVPTSEITVNSYDIQSATTNKICKIGNQCKISGQITLIDPATGLEIPPPYGYFIQITCETSTHDVMNCNNFDTRVENIMTYADKSFSYTFTTDQNDPPGQYVVLVSVASKFTTTDPETGSQIKVRRDGILNLELVA